MVEFGLLNPRYKGLKKDYIVRNVARFAERLKEFDPKRVGVHILKQRIGDIKKKYVKKRREDFIDINIRINTVALINEIEKQFQ